MSFLSSSLVSISFVYFSFVYLNIAVAGESRIFFAGGNDVIYGKEHMIVKQNTPTFVKNVTKIKSRTTNPAKDNVDKRESLVVVFPDFPFLPSSSSYLNIGNESAATVSQFRLGGYQNVCKVTCENAYPGIENSNLSLYLPEQRQKFSITATQCGILSSFSPNSPSL